MNKFVEPRPHGRRLGRPAFCLEAELADAARLWRLIGRIWRRIKRAVENGWLWAHESGTYSRFTQDGKDLFA